LVKDGATAIAALGQDIDTAFVDLKGGTTGQILAKASNTDLDYSWITNDVGDITAVTAGTGISGGGTSGAVTITNSMATAIDAKGDLVAGTGADTFARLGVAANDSILTAASGETTGLKWDTGVWTSYTPTMTAQSGTFTTVSATGSYKQIGKTVFYTLEVTITTAGTAAGFIRATLPSTPNSSFTGVSQNINVTGIMGSANIPNGDGGAFIAKYDNTTFITSGHVIRSTGFYTVA
jgi:hypothetical protein